MVGGSFLSRTHPFLPTFDTTTDGILGEILLWSLKECLLDLYSDRVEEAWSKAYSHVLKAVMPLAKGTEIENNLKKLASTSKKGSIADEETRFRRNFISQRSRSRESSASNLADLCYDVMGRSNTAAAAVGGVGGGGGGLGLRSRLPSGVHGNI
jgi:hypothetical protein